MVLENCQAIVIPYDGRRARDAKRCCLKPDFLPRERPYWRAREAGALDWVELALDDLKPFLPGLEAVLDDDAVSELMINGPGTVFVERRGRVTPLPLPALDEEVVRRAAVSPGHVRDAGQPTRCPGRSSAAGWSTASRRSFTRRGLRRGNAGCSRWFVFGTTTCRPTAGSWRRSGRRRRRLLRSGSPESR